MKKKQKSTTPKNDKQRYELNKIIYFDKETIKNILQEYYKGTKQTVVNSSDSASVAIGSNIEAEADIKLSLPFLSRLRFLFSSKIPQSIFQELMKQLQLHQQKYPISRKSKMALQNSVI